MLTFVPNVLVFMVFDPTFNTSTLCLCQLLYTFSINHTNWFSNLTWYPLLDGH